MGIVQVLLSDQSIKNSEPQASIEEAVATDHTMDTSMSIIFDSNIDVKTRIKTMAQEMLRSLKEIKEPPQARVSKSGRGIPGGSRPNTNMFQEHHIDSAAIDPNRFNNNGTLNKNRRVKCKLCSKVLIKPNFGTHMKKFHLPDEECSFCGEEFPAMMISSHQKKCFGVKRGDREEGMGPGRFQKRRLEFSSKTGKAAEVFLTSLVTQGPASGGSGTVTGHIGASTNESEDVPWGSEGALGGSEDIEAVPGGARAGDVPGGAEAVQEGAGGVPGEAEAVPGGAKVASGGAEGVPGGADAVPGGAEAVPEGARVLPVGTGAVPGGTGAVIGGAGAVPGGVGNVPGGAGALPGGTAAAIGGAVAVPEGKGMVSGEAGAVLGGAGAVLGEAGAVLGKAGTVLGGAGAVPRDSNKGQEISMVGITMKFGNKSFKVMMPKRKTVKKAMRKIAARLGKEVSLLFLLII